ncbi:MAG: hypothetical protein RL026_2762 [Pseudomonadota bacterium]
MTILSHRHRLAFIAIPKSASHSIRFALRDQLGPEDEEQVALFVQRRIDHPVFAADGHGHQTARQVRDALGEARWPQYCSFAVLRNPWERFVSCVAFMMRNNGWFADDPQGAMRRVLESPQQLSRVHYWPQSRFVCDDDGQVMVTRLLRAEQLQAGFDELCHATGLAPRVLEQRNASEHQHYTAYYDDALRGAVGALYADDIARFGYAYGD